MTIASTNIEDIYAGNGSTTNFPITFEYSDVSEIKLFLDNVESLAFTFDNAIAPTTVIANVAPAAGVEVKVKRVTEVVQPTDLQPNQNYTAAAESIEKQLDKIIQMVQEIEVPTSSGSSSTTSANQVFPDWVVSTAYDKGTVVFDPSSQRYYRVKNLSYTSDPVSISADILTGALTIFPENNQGEKGDQGDQGIAGIDGINGTTGPTGPQGVNGIFSQIASQGEAEAGTNNSNGMTPLRSKQAFDAFYNPIATALATTISGLNTTISTLSAEINLLKSSISTTIGRYSGAQFLENGTSGPVDLSGLNGGSALLFNSNGTEFVNVQFYIKRGAEEFSSFEAILQFVNGQWYFCRKETFVLNDTLEIDGVTLSVNTVGVEGQIRYESNPLVGAYVKEDNYIMWLGQEIPKTIIDC